MKYFFAVLAGVVTAAAATFLHLFLPPFGISLAIIGTFTSIWAVGRTYGKRRFKIVAALGWSAIFLRASTFGVGKEIFVQGNNLGNIFFFLSFLALAIAIALPTN
jgi:hypothetical protein